MDKPQTFAINIEGRRKNSHAITAKDIILYIIRTIGTAGGIGTVLEYRGETISDLSMENRMTICNMTIEAGARAGVVAPDEKTFDFIRGRRYAPTSEQFEKSIEHWKTLRTDPNAKFDKSITFNVGGLAPQVTWGTNPGMVAGITDKIGRAHV